MRAGFIVLLLAYVLSQFYRAFLAVLAPVLTDELGMTAAELSLASGVWFAVFAAMQIPVGIALDRLGPRRTAAWLLALGGGGGATLFALAQSPAAVVVAMGLIGLGCAPVLMASLYIYARTYSPAVFASLAGATIGVGSLGNLASAAPLAFTVASIGWRAAIALLAGLTLAVALALLAFVRDPACLAPVERTSAVSLGAVLRQPALWVMVPLIAVNYAPAAGIRGLWAGPYMADVYGLDTQGIGAVTLWMALAMTFGNFAYGPLDRWLGTRKWVILGGNLLCAACLIALGLLPPGSIATAAMLLAAAGLFGSSFPMVMAHARSYFPPQLIGRGVSLVNFLSIGGAGLLQIASGRLHAAVAARGGTLEAPYQGIFLFFGLLLVAGCASYVFARDRLD